MNTIQNYFNPFSNQFQKSTKDFENLSTLNKTVAVIAGIVGAIISPFILFTGSFALFQLSVKWLKGGDDVRADSVDKFVHQQEPFSNTKNNKSSDLVTSQHYDIEYLDSNSESSTDNDSESASEGKEDIWFYESYPYNVKIKSGTMSPAWVKEQYGIECYSVGINDTGTGSGKVIYFDFSIYEGELLNWERHGNGTLTRDGIHYTNSILEGSKSTWVNDKLTFGHIYGLGTRYNRNNTSYKGEINDWQANGQGFMFDQHRNSYEGTFKDGKFINGVKTISINSNTKKYERYEQGRKVEEQNEPFTNGVFK